MSSMLVASSSSSCSPCPVKYASPSFSESSLSSSLSSPATSSSSIVTSFGVTSSTSSSSGVTALPHHLDSQIFDSTTSSR
ncbi:hypothetical protein F2Q69_00012428 [Brassica cretica]|uniref:Uncharacterized protein n=1 Tax=Brassica cretica TaxID=69181 RepID=A0A8S9R395_BRACR|nr:hypothetical protein F2Q69_00012428 [Brassica cretica]